MAYNWSECQRATWAIGAFTNQTGFDQPPLFQYDHWGLDMAARATYLPWYDEPSGGRGLLHTGLDYAYRSAPDDNMIFATKPESGFATAVVNLNMTDVKQWQVADAEAALVYGPLSVQSEVFGSTINRTSGASNNLYGGYAFVSYFLTGENRPYNRKLGVFDRVRPYENFFRVRTCDGDVAHRLRRLGTGLPLLLHRRPGRTDGEGGRPGRRPHLRRQLVPEPLHQDHVQLRPFPGHVQQRGRDTPSRAGASTSSRCGSPWISNGFMVPSRSA